MLNLAYRIPKAHFLLSQVGDIWGKKLGMLFSIFLQKQYIPFLIEELDSFSGIVGSRVSTCVMAKPHQFHFKKGITGPQFCSAYAKTLSPSSWHCFAQPHSVVARASLSSDFFTLLSPS